MSARSMPLMPVELAATDATVPAAMPLGRRLGKYTLTDTLGEGAMGVVYRAVDPHIERVVAVKTIRKSFLDTPTGNQSAALRFRNEARAAGRLTHPGIVAIYEYGEEADQCFIVMEYVEGASLLRCTSPQQRLPLADVLSVCTQLLHALNYAHAHGVWHRDIKPSNLIVTAGGQLKITDFGIARVDATALTQDASIMGSCGYMAPECYQSVELDQRVDLFACGVLLYELLTGRRPFNGVPGAVMHQLLHQDPPPLASAGGDALEAALLAPFEPIVARALAKDRAQRYPGAQEMLDALTQAAQRPVAARVSVAAVQALMAPRPKPSEPAAAPPGTEPMPMTAPARLFTLPRKPQPLPISLPHRAHAVAAAPEPQPAPALAALPAAASFDPAALDTLAGLLAHTFGPVARIVVQRAAAKCQTLPALVSGVADSLPTADHRQRFIAMVQQAWGTTSVKPQPAGARATLPLAGATPLREDTVRLAQDLLTRQIGPIARVIVRRARSDVASREQFIAALADMAADCIEPSRLRAELERVL